MVHWAVTNFWWLNREGNDIHTFVSRRFINENERSSPMQVVLIFIYIYLFIYNIYIFIYTFIYVQSEEVCHCYVPSLGEYDVPVLIWQRTGIPSQAVCYVPCFGQVIGHQIGPTLLATKPSSHHILQHHHCSTSISSNNITNKKHNKTHLFVGLIPLLM